MSIINLIFPNFYLVASSIWPDLKQGLHDTFCKKAEPEIQEEDVFEKKRRDLIAKYNFILKEEFKNRDPEGEDGDDEEE